MIPDDRLPYTQKEITKILYEDYPNKSGKKGTIKKFLSHTKRQIQIDYLYDIFLPILSTQKEGTVLQVGNFNNPKSYAIHAFIHLCLITGDNEQLDYLCGTCFRRKKGKCRQCDSEKIHDMDPEVALGNFRNDEETKRIGKNSTKVLQAQCKNTGTKYSEEINGFCYACPPNMNCGGILIIHI